MDIQVASNFERYLYYRLDCRPDKVRETMEQFRREKSIALEGPGDPAFAAGRGDTESTIETIRRYHRDFGYLLDPHTAVGVTVAERFSVDGMPTVCLATAHPAKFADTMEKAVGPGLAVHPSLEALKSLGTRKVLLEPRREDVEEYVRATLGHAGK